MKNIAIFGASLVCLTIFSSCGSGNAATSNASTDDLPPQVLQYIEIGGKYELSLGDVPWDDVKIISSKGGGWYEVEPIKRPEEHYIYNFNRLDALRKIN